MASQRGRFIVTGLAVLLAASVLHSVAAEREKRRLAEAYNQAQQVVQQLSDERGHLNDELVQTRETVEGQAGQLSGLQQELDSVQKRLGETVTEIAALQHEHDQLRQENSSLNAQLSSVITEKEQLEARLSSLKELRLAIRDVKQKIWNERWAAWHDHIRAVHQADREQLALGNHGYVVREGKSTLGENPRLHVHIHEPEAP